MHLSECFKCHSFHHHIVYGATMCADPRFTTPFHIEYETGKVYGIVIFVDNEAFVIYCIHFEVICDIAESAGYFEEHSGPNPGSM